HPPYTHEPRQRFCQISDAEEVPAERRLERLFPTEVVEASGEVDHGLDAVGAPNAVDHCYPLWCKHASAYARTAAVASGWEGQVRSTEFNAVELVQDPSHVPARSATGRKHRRHGAVEPTRIL